MNSDDTDGISAGADVTDLESFDVKKKKLHQCYKQYKAGMLKWNEISQEYQLLLKKYYKCGPGVV
jgi:hypothetical protein